MCTWAELKTHQQHEATAGPQFDRYRNTFRIDKNIIIIYVEAITIKLKVKRERFNFFVAVDKLKAENGTESNFLN